MADMPGAVWRKSARSNAGGNCVEVAETPDAIGVRDSKDPHGPVLAFDPHTWRGFVAGVKEGRYDR
jgi:hypothetical protein